LDIIFKVQPWYRFYEVNNSVCIGFSIENKKRIAWKLSFAANSGKMKKTFVIEDERQVSSGEWENKGSITLYFLVIVVIVTQRKVWGRTLCSEA
jgi:hypothetical protein